MRKFVIANWKMNKTNTEAVEFINGLRPLIEEKDNVWVCPPATALSIVHDALKGAGEVGAQNIYYENKGAFTGEISANMAKSAGASFALVGHSERRHIFNETNEQAAKKIIAALEAGLKVVYCVGETLDEHGKLKSVLTTQLKALKGIDLKNVIVAYEPVWAIGTGKVAQDEDIVKAHTFIKEFVLKNFNGKVKVLYGGSVNPDNIDGILKLKEVDGVLVGGASLDLTKFSKLFMAARKV